MNKDSVIAQLNGLVDGSTFDMPVLTLALAALAFGCVMATAPKALRPVVFAYLIAMAAVINLHEMHYLYWGIGGGFATAAAFRMLGFGRARRA